MNTNTQADAFDVSEFEDVLATDVVIKNPTTGAPTALVISLAGPEHPKRKRVAFDRARKLRAGLMKTGKMQLGDPEDDEADELDQLVDFTLGWRGLVIAGQPVQCTPAAVRTLYSDPKRRWLRNQVKAALEEAEAFIKRSVAA